MDRRMMLWGCLAGVTAATTRVGAMSQASGRAIEATVGDMERQFAATMARRDFRAFADYVSEEAVFLGGSDAVRRILRGRSAVGEAWKSFFEGPTAPFSWGPDLVQALDSGTLALTSGPVRDPAGAITNRFNSIWRLEADRRWRVVFDFGSPVCGR